MLKKPSSPDDSSLSSLEILRFYQPPFLPTFSANLVGTVRQLSWHFFNLLKLQAFLATLFLSREPG
jgi:hypothetical protein